jgi:CMP-N-acetylneuraminic acid synthetase
MVRTGQGILGIIPARGGSKRIPNKNIVPLAGKPLISYTILAAQNSRLLTDCLISTDSSKIAKVAARYGGKVPFMRPRSLATDTASTYDVVIHALRRFEKTSAWRVKAVLLLQPTAPLRNAHDIDTCIRLLERNPGTDSVVSFYEAGAEHPNYMYVRRGSSLLPLFSAKTSRRRQDFEVVLVRNGVLYLTRREAILRQGSMIGRRIVPYLMPRERSVNIDEPADLRWAELLLKHHGR